MLLHIASLNVTTYSMPKCQESRGEMIACLNVTIQEGRGEMTHKLWIKFLKIKLLTLLDCFVRTDEKRRKCKYWSVAFKALKGELITVWAFLMKTTGVGWWNNVGVWLQSWISDCASFKTFILISIRGTTSKKGGHRSCKKSHGPHNNIEVRCYAFFFFSNRHVKLC